MLQKYDRVFLCSVIFMKLPLKLSSCIVQLSITKTSKLTLEKYYELQTSSNLTIFPRNSLFSSIFQCRILRCIFCCFNSHISLWLNLNISPYVLGLIYLLLLFELFLMFFQNFLWRFDSLFLNVWVLYKLGI